METKIKAVSLKKRLVTLFFSMLSISAFTFGGGFVIVTLMKRRFVDDLHWLDEDEMLDMTAIAQSCPGAIAVNGAQVYDIQGDRTIAAAEIPLERTLELMETLDEYPVAYDCFVQGKGWMERRLWEHAADYTDDWYCLQVLHDLRTPVDDLKAFLRQLGGDAQKVQFFTKDQELRLNLLKELPRRWPDIAVTTSVPTNVELNILRANKGEALKQLTDYLGLSMEQVMAVEEPTPRGSKPMTS